MKYLDSWEEFLNPITNRMEAAFEQLKFRKKLEMIVPRAHEVLNPFFHCPFDELKVVIPGSRPYTELYLHKNEDDDTTESRPIASGFSYGTITETHVPARLKRIISCININQYPQDFHQELLERDDVSSWGERQANQGVFMYNMSLTGRNGDALAHQNIWHPFSIALMEMLAEHKPLVWLFMDKESERLISPLLGPEHAQVKALDPMGPEFISKHPFTQVNECLDVLGYKAIEW